MHFKQGTIEELHYALRTGKDKNVKCYNFKGLAVRRAL